MRLFTLDGSSRRLETVSRFLPFADLRESPSWTPTKSRKPASGKGVPIGEVDSGYDDAHSQLSASRYSGLIVGSNAAISFNGVAFDTNVVAGNPDKTVGVLHGIPQFTQTAAQTIDNTHVTNVCRAVAATGARIIGMSFGS